MPASRTQTFVKAGLVAALLLLYIHFFGLTTVENYLSGDITINKKYKIVKNLDPPGTLENNQFSFILNKTELIISKYFSYKAIMILPRLNTSAWKSTPGYSCGGEMEMEDVRSCFENISYSYSDIVLNTSQKVHT